MTSPVEADYGIRQLHARFIDAVWRKDAQAFGACFAQDGEWKIAAMHIKGRAEITAKFALLLSACDRVQIIAATPLLDFAENGVSGRVSVTELAKMADGSSAMTLGIYYDRYVEEDGRWRFASRHWGLHYRGPVDLSAALVECPDYGPPPGMPAADEPTYTRRAI
jgi:uncharacterized protein (TIGR02246 family)